MVEPKLTDQQKAQKAIRLLWNALYGSAEYHIAPNDIYDARRILEQYIEQYGPVEAKSGRAVITLNSEDIIEMSISYAAPNRIGQL